jgi:hypothetical protein
MIVCAGWVPVIRDSESRTTFDRLVTAATAVGWHRLSPVLVPDDGILDATFLGDSTHSSEFSTNLPASH